MKKAKYGVVYERTLNQRPPDRARHTKEAEKHSTIQFVASVHTALPMRVILCVNWI